jgi:phosphocarrier protein
VPQGRDRVSDDDRAIPAPGDPLDADDELDPPSAALPGTPASATLLCRTVTIVNRRGLHARAAAKFVTLAERFGASVEVLRDGQNVSARSIMGLMMLGAGMGSTIQLQADGWDAKEALEALTGLVEAGFNEQD